MITFTEKNIKSIFQAIELVLYNSEKAFSQLKIKTPSPLLQSQALQLEGQATKL